MAAWPQATAPLFDSTPAIMQQPARRAARFPQVPQHDDPRPLQLVVCSFIAPTVPVPFPVAPRPPQAGGPHLGVSALHVLALRVLGLDLIILVFHAAKDIHRHGRRRRRGRRRHDDRRGRRRKRRRRRGRKYARARLVAAEVPLGHPLIAIRFAVSGLPQSDSLPILLANRIFCACSGVTSSVTALGTVGCSCRSFTS